MDLEKNRPQAEVSPRRMNWAQAAVLVVLIFALLGGFIFYRIENWPRRSVDAGVSGLERIGRDARDQLVRLAHLQPQVTINNRVYLEQKSTVAELSVVSRKVEVEHEMEHTWAGSTKRIRLHGSFLVKAGFDLRKKFSVRVQPKEIIVELPHAELLSVEEQSVEVLALENGFWNRVSSTDLESELAVLPRLAREKSVDLPAEAESAFTHQLLGEFRPPLPIRTIFPAPTPGG